jgi:c-di-GMP-binding flagellar brake protein YcgR
MNPFLNESFALGQPLPWAVFDRDGHLLAREGFVIETVRQLEVLSKNGMLRETSPGGARIPLVMAKRPGKAEDQGATRGHGDAMPALTFEALDLAVGTRLQMQRVGNDERRYLTRLVGYSAGVSVIVRTPSDDGGIVLFREGETAILRAFSGTAAFAFTAVVLAVRFTPETYLHLAYPKRVEGAAVRNQKRVDVELIATAHRADEALEEGTAAKVLDLSAGGAKLRTHETLGSQGDRLLVAFRLPTPHGEATLSLPAEIRSSTTDDEGQVHHGIRFVDIEPLQALALRGYVAAPLRAEEQRKAAPEATP